MKRWPQSEGGHSIRTKSMRRILSGVIEYPHFGQRVLSDARTLSRLIFGLRSTLEIVSRQSAASRRKLLLGSDRRGSKIAVVPSEEAHDSSQCHGVHVGLVRN
jgi:hypothetical protein